MNSWEKNLSRKQLDQKLNGFKPMLNITVPKGGWIKSIRQALGMTTTVLAKRINVDQSRISRIESAEESLEVKLSTLQKVADGLGVKFVYGFVTENDLESLIREQSYKVAKERLRRIDHSMKLEMQGVSKKQFDETLDELTDQIMAEESKTLWDS